MRRASRSRSRVSGDNGGVYEASAGQFTPLASMANPVSLSFSSDGQTLYALDAATAPSNGHQASAATVFKLWRCRESPTRSPFSRSKIRKIGQLLYVAGGSDRVVRILDVASQQI